jgi:hypothetical protein
MFSVLAMTFSWELFTSVLVGFLPANRADFANAKS